MDRHIDGHRVERVHLVPGVVAGHALAVALGADLLHGAGGVAVETHPEGGVAEGRTRDAHARLHPGRRDGREGPIGRVVVARPVVRGGRRAQQRARADGRPRRGRRSRADQRMRVGGRPCRGCGSGWQGDRHEDRRCRAEQPQQTRFHGSSKELRAGRIDMAVLFRIARVCRQQVVSRPAHCFCRRPGATPAAGAQSSRENNRANELRNRARRPSAHQSSIVNRRHWSRSSL